jgi:hypothetical protein
MLNHDETGKISEINKTGGELGTIYGEDTDERKIWGDDIGRNSEDNKDNTDDGALTPRCSTRTNKG